MAQSQQYTLMANEFSNNAGSGWTNLSGTITTDPSCVNDVRAPRVNIQRQHVGQVFYGGDGGDGDVDWVGESGKLAYQLPVPPARHSTTARQCALWSE